METEVAPFLLDIDEDFLAHLANADSWLVIMAEKFAAEMVEDEEVVAIYEWQLTHMRKHGKIAAQSVLEDEFDLELLPPEAAIGDLLDRMRKRYVKNQGRTRLEKIIKQQKAEPLALPQLLLREGRELSTLLTPRGEMFGTGDVERALQRYAIKVEQGPGPSFGYEELDEYFYGMTGLTFWIGSPKTYKSWQMIVGIRKNVLMGRQVWLYSLELPTVETDMRLRCILAGVPFWKWLRNCLSAEDIKLIREASEYIDGCGVFNVVKPDIGHRGIDDLVHTAADAGADAIWIDQLQYVENEKGESLGELNKPGEYWGVLHRARDLSDDIPLSIAHQFHRESMYSEEMPGINHAKGSSAIEETATVALGLWANKDMRRSNEIEIGTLIARNQQFKSWSCQVALTNDCDFRIIGEAPETRGD